MSMKLFAAALIVGSFGLIVVTLKGAPDWAAFATGFTIFNQVIWSCK